MITCPDCRYLCKPDIPDKPDLIIVGEAPGREEKVKGIPFIGASGKVLRGILKKYGLSAIILNSQNCWTQDKPTAERISSCREKFLDPILLKFSNLPVVGLGEYSIHSIMRREGALSKHINKAYIIGNHPILFTYHPAYYLRNHDPSVLEHIDLTIKTAIRPIVARKFTISPTSLPRNCERIIVDIETTGKDLPYPSAQGASEIIVVGVRANSENFMLLPKDFEREEIRYFFEGGVGKFIGHEIIFDLLFLKHCFNLRLRRRVYDTLIREKNWSTLRHSYGLKYFAKLMGFPPYEAEANTIIKLEGSLKSMPLENIMNYCCYDLEATDQLEKCQRSYGEDLNFSIEMKYIPLILQMIDNGMYLDLGKVEEIKQGATDDLADKREILYKQAGVEFNLESPKQVKEILTKLNIKVINTRRETLEPLVDQYPFLKTLIEYRSITKLIETSCEGYLKRIDNDSILHSRIRVHGTETTRLSSSNPNLQNIDPRIRPAFVSRYRGGKIISTDINSLEYRLIAHVSEDKGLVSLFNNKEDIHRAMGQIIFGKKDINEKERKEGKLANYIAIYGGGVDKLCESIGISREKAEEILGSQYRGVALWKEKTTRHLESSLFVNNMFGMIREFKSPISFNDIRESINWQIQSAGHQVLIVYAIELMKYILPPILMVDEIHDEILFDSPPELIDETSGIIEKIGGNLWNIIDRDLKVKLKVPIFAEVEVI